MSSGSDLYCASAWSIRLPSSELTAEDSVSNSRPRSVTSRKQPISSTATPAVVFGQRSLSSVTPSLSWSPGGGGGSGGGAGGGGGGGGGAATCSGSRPKSLLNEMPYVRGWLTR